MPKIINAYSPDDSLAAALSGVAQSIFGGNTAQQELYRQKALEAGRGNLSYKDIQDAARRGPLDFNDPTTRAAVYGLPQPREVFEAHRGVVTNTRGAMSPEAANAFVGAGGSYGSTGPGFAQSQATELAKTRMATDRAAETQMAIDARTSVPVLLPDGRQVYVRKTEAPAFTQSGQGTVVPTMDSVKAVTAQRAIAENPADPFGTLAPSAQHFLGAQPSGERPTNWIDPGSRRQGRTADGKTDLATGQPLPPTAQLVSPTNQSGPSAFTPNAPTNDMVQTLQRKAVAAREVSSLVDRADALVAGDPTIVGAPGIAQKFGQNAVAAARDVLTALGNGNPNSAIETIRTDAIQKLGVDAARLLPELFKPQISELEAVHGIMVYKTAEMLGQTGRGASDKDIAAARHIIGNPGSMWESSQSFRTKLAAIKSVADAQSVNADRMLQSWNIGGQPTTPAPVQAPAPTAPAATPQAERWQRGGPLGWQRVQ